MKCSLNLYVILISSVAAIGGFLFGFDSGVINGTMEGLKKTFQSDSVLTGFNVASMLLGCAIGAFFAGWLADQHGRRLVLIVSAVLFGLSAWGSGIANGSLEFIIYRVIGGFAVGAASVICPAYICEVTPSRYRGALSSLQQIAIISGLFGSFMSNYLIADSAGSSTEVWWLGYEAWRWMFWMELIPVVVFFIALFFIPESPRYLASKGNKLRAIQILKRVVGSDADQKYEEIMRSMGDELHKGSFKDVYDPKTQKIRKIIWIGIGLAALQQMVGINVVFYYGAVLWQSAGFQESDALMINVLSGGLSILACLFTTWKVDLIGRKPLLVVGSIGMTITLLIMSIIFYRANLDARGNLQIESLQGIILLVVANLYVIFFNFSWGPVMWIMLGEMFPNAIRGLGLSVSGLSQWIVNFGITMTFPIMLASIGLGLTYSFYAISAFCSIFFVLLYVHETKGKELEEMK